MNYVDNKTFEGIINKGYIHSNPNNFLDQTSLNLKVGDQKGEFGADMESLKAFQDTLEEMIQKITYKCNNFYQLFDINAVDRIEFYKDSENPIVVQLDGAKEFEKRYMWSKEEKGSSIGVINKIMSSEEYQNKVIEKLRASSEDLFLNDSKISEYLEDYVTANGTSNDEMIEKAYKKIGKNIDNEITNILFQITDRGRGKTVSDPVQNLLKSFFVKEGKLTELAEFVGYQENAFTAKKRFERLRSNLEDYYNKNIFKGDIVVKIMWEVLKEEVKNKGTKEVYNYLGEEDGKVYKNFKESILKSFRKLFKVSGDMLKISAKNYSLRGSLFEQSLRLTMSIGIDVSNLKDIKNIEVTGQGEDNNGEDGNSKVQPGFDIVVIDKNNKEYRIQAKNTFSKEEWGTIHLQSEIKVDTFAENVFGRGSEEFKLFEYVFFNRAFLEKYGLYHTYEEGQMGEKGRRIYERAHWNSTNDEQLMDLVNFYLNQTMLYLISGKILSMKDTPQILEVENTLNKGNLFFAYRQKYLIPISIFLLSSYIIIAKIIAAWESKEIDKIEDFRIGRLTYRKGLSISNIKYEEQKLIDMYHDKIAAGAEYDAKNIGNKRVRLEYPEKVLEVGNIVFNDYVQNASLPRLNFNNLNIKRLNDLLDFI